MRPSNIRCQQSEQGVELAILGEITSYTAQDIISALAFFKDQPVIITMMSGGGDAFASLGLYDYMRDKDVTVRVYGIAAPQLLGSIPQIGTLYNGVVIDEKFVCANTESVDSILDSL